MEIEWSTWATILILSVSIFILRWVERHWTTLFTFSNREAELMERIRELEDQLGVLWKLLKEAHAEIALVRLELEDRRVITKRPETAAQISVLLVAPHSDLPLVDAELQDVLRSGLNVVPVFSPITQPVLLRELRRNAVEGLYLAGHMDVNGNFLLDDGEKLSTSALTAMVRGRFKWIFLNTCHSIQAAQTLQSETNTDVICTLMAVPDIDAYRTGSLFASALAETRNVRKAYEESKPGENRVYLFLSGYKA